MPKHARRTKQRSTQRGFTLVEVTVSLAIVTVLMLGLSGSILVSSYAIPSPSETGTIDMQVHDLKSLLHDDVANASRIVYNKTGETRRLTLTAQSTGTRGEGTTIKYDFIEEANYVRRRVDARPWEILLNGLENAEIVQTLDGSQVRYLHVVLEINDSSQVFFEQFIRTPHKPDWVE